MKNTLLAVALAAAAAAPSARAVAWKNLSDSAHCSGPKITEADLAGKVVMVDCWGVNCPPCRALLPRIEAIWKAYRHKPFMLVGNHCQGRDNAEIAKLVKANKLTYPIYQGFAVASGEPSFNGIPFIYVVNHRGKVVYAGRSEREATEAAVNALGAVGAPASLYGDVDLGKNYKSLEKQLVLGRPVKSVVQQLERDVKRGQGKFAKPAEREKGEQAAQIIKAVESARGEIKEEIEGMKASNPAGAVKLIEDFCRSFPEEAAAYRPQIPELKKKAREMAAAAKAAAKAGK